ncbi:MAG: MBL fold metallo-hydrolase [Clostridiales bacterium]|jgi:beta-lactamase-like protein|nr:MBL fold metallo-hydrolase [Clostridiales bacterium]
MIKFCSLYSGSSGNSIYIGTERTNLLVDAGVSGIRIAGALREICVEPQQINGILITHEHSDHIKGAGIFSRKFNVPVYAREKTWEAMRKEIGPLKEENIRMIDQEYFTVGDIDICNYSIPHDAVDPVAYTFYVYNRKISVATDIGCVTDTIHENVIGSDIVLIESNHDVEMLKNGAYPWPLKKRILSDHGHLSNDHAAALVTELAQNGTKHVYLGHLSHENNYPELAFSASRRALAECGICVNRDIFVNVASREHYSEVTEL